MTCPSCGAPVQPGDSFCVSCGHALHPADATRRLEDPVPSAYGAVGDASPDAGTPGPTLYRPVIVESPRGEKTWASGSSFPAPNPYADPPHPVRRGTMLNGRPVGGRGGSSLLKGLGLAIIALWLISHGLVFGHAGGLVLLVILLLIAGSIGRSRLI
jgi:zinc-ribbon domain